MPIDSQCGSLISVSFGDNIGEKGDDMCAKARFCTVLLFAVLALCLAGCASVYDKDESRGNAKLMGESAEVSVQFNFLCFYERGPYKLRVTPVGVSTMVSDGDTIPCMIVDYELISTPDGGPAEYATCTLAVNLLSEDCSEVEFGIWCTDDAGTQMDPRNSQLEIGKEYRFYIPLVSSWGVNNDLIYVTVSDRSGFYARSGETYWYTV